MEHTVTGGCLCRAVRYTVSGRAKSVEHCHCSMCRRAHGALFASGALVDSVSLRIDTGQERLRRYQSSPGNWREFCGECGSQLFVRIDHLPDECYYWTGTLDEGMHPGHRVENECHIFTEAAPAWPSDGRAPRYEGIPEGIGPGSAPGSG